MRMPGAKTPADASARCNRRSIRSAQRFSQPGKSFNSILAGGFFIIANCIARTELHRNYSAQQSREYMAADRIEYLQWRLSGKHPKLDICDYHARVDAWGLVPGIYPKAQAPQPPAHPHCLPGDALITASGRITAVSKRQVVVHSPSCGKGARGSPARRSAMARSR